MTNSSATRVEFSHEEVQQAAAKLRRYRGANGGYDYAYIAAMLESLLADNVRLSEDNEKLRVSNRRAPVQGYAAGIPWEMHLRAYDVYVKRYGHQQALIEGGCRGGFGVRELDMFIPGWRKELDELDQLRARLQDKEVALLAAIRRIGELEKELDTVKANRDWHMSHANALRALIDQKELNRE